MAEDFTDRLRQVERQVEREIRASQARQQADMLPYCQIQGITGARNIRKEKENGIIPPD
jgi:hypothetical protein